jgi:cytochrome P450
MKQLTLSDLLAQETKRHPAAFYARLREQGPLAYLSDFRGMGGAWITTTYADALAIAKDPRFIKDREKIAPSMEEQPVTQARTSQYVPFAWRRDLLTVDPPDHTRLRQLVSKAFTPRMIEQLRPRIQQITDELLDAVAEQGTMDLIADFAFPLPITAISDLLEIPVTDRQQFRAWTQLLVNAGAEPAALRAAEVAFVDYIKRLLAGKRDNPGSDLTSGLVQAEEQGDSLRENELISMIWLLIIAGHETTMNLIGTGMLALLQHAEQMRLLQHDPSLISSAIEELLRYTTPVSITSFRWANEDIPMHGNVIRKGEMVLISLIAADMDPRQFHDPEGLDITREENAHLAFGKGIHYCLGAPLARLEGQIAIGTLLRRLPHLRLASDPAHLSWSRNFSLRGLTSLPVAF